MLSPVVAVCGLTLLPAQTGDGEDCTLHFGAYGECSRFVLLSVDGAASPTGQLGACLCRLGT